MATVFLGESGEPHEVEGGHEGCVGCLVRSAESKHNFTCQSCGVPAEEHGYDFLGRLGFHTEDARAIARAAGDKFTREFIRDLIIERVGIQIPADRAE